ncbi:hypothetical protein [Frateuria terrea]|uniref:KTSC domain-containing protein n=1 Tax=Frateuria terrea TaxID=529704 RepID=A0A1H6SPB0_9GAMM|nr:hypothetical protein [Frateuria terrea]SEI65695.1 hypothetical protein SAMN04487997_1355 [Frateuria terrea]SFP25441.1 hypothetical protein SAMN02927913_1270 [Frateuria terrea]
MQPYRHLDSHSGVTAYELGADWIRVWFVNGADYRYSAARAGAEHVRNMQILAQAGEGLATYISKFVHDDYDREA